jgi:hypothetical protein
VLNENEESEDLRISAKDEVTGAPDTSSPAAEPLAGETLSQNSSLYERELAAAKKHFGSGVVGGSETHRRPFTEQIMSDTEAMFPWDSDKYKTARSQMWAVLGRYFTMRVVTSFLHAGLVILLVAIYDAAISDGGSSLLSKLLEATGLSDVFATWWPLLMAALAFLAFGMRSAVRGFFFFGLTRRAETLSYDVFKRIDDIATRVTEACAKVRLRAGEGWPERAKNWVIIALWNAKRGEYLDRFITTVIWKVGVYIERMQNVFLVVNVAAIAAIYACFRGVPAPGEETFAADLIFIGALTANSFFLWHKAGQKPNAFWKDQFRKSAPEQTDETENYADKISDEIENLVVEIISKEYGQSGRNG